MKQVRLVLIALVMLACGVSSQEARPDRKPSSGTSFPADVLAFEREMEAAVVRGDVAYLDRVLASDFMFTHGDGWTTGGAPLKVDDRASWLATVGKAPYSRRDLDQVKAELHGDIAITYGRYVADSRDAAPDRTHFDVWFERVYAKRRGQWQHLSHRTVHGPTYSSGPLQTR